MCYEPERLVVIIPDRIKDAQAQVETTARDLLKEIETVGVATPSFTGEVAALRGALAQLDRAREG